jgi:phosphohistidine swiveling domain-containing protein
VGVTTTTDPSTVAPESLVSRMGDAGVTARPETAADPGFAIVWADPTDRDLEWSREDMHHPFAVTPLSADYIQVMVDGMAYGGRKIDRPYVIDLRFWHGYAYVTARDLLPAAEMPAALDALTGRKRALIATTAAYWRDDALPELRSIRDWFRAVDVETMPADRLDDAWREAWVRAGRGWGIHFFLIRGPYQVTDDLADLYESLVPDASPGEALRLIQGRADELQEVDRALDDLAALVTADPALRPRLEGDSPLPTIAALREEADSGPFVAALDAFLFEHGHLGGSFDDLAFPSWADEPDIVLGDIARRLASERPAAVDRQRALLADADALADRVRDRLADLPEELARFETLLADARAVGPLTEVHNYWIDRLMQACLRTFALRIGRRLVDAGVIARPLDILYLSRDEVGGSLRVPTNRRIEVAERRAIHARQTEMTPPASVGKPADPNAEMDRFDGTRFEPEPDGRLRGTGASAGTARGTARIVLGPADFGKVRPGDVIVAPSSNPSWVPLFAIAGGLLVNTGGVLSHAAVVAREFGLPAVVGLGDATSRIPDGSTVELDGATGYVRIL